MTHFILVHGACHGAWCWRDIVPALQAQGHSVSAIDLPGRGGGVAGLSLADQAEAVLAAYDGSAVLVGHSAGGLAISAAAERAPDRVERLIYVAALIPQNGDTVGGLMGALTGERAEVRFKRAEDKLSYCFDTDGAGPALYNDADQATMDWALERICYEPSDPHRDPIQLGANFDSADKAVIVCTQDRVIPAVDQDRMAAGITAIRRMDTGHSPFLSDPAGLAKHLNDLGA
ncbi:alpha/beta fold hydrolase [Pseudooceanicola sp. MF1-13]|uniref:alpha/beta fold hydrolase n=1 Tax=Pseudooceanicola sp. MF1-13 TaxID=3379095 RepID=UPI0038918C14